jgi:hypothetical protein
MTKQRVSPNARTRNLTIKIHIRIKARKSTVAPGHFSAAC